jgi:hypothetical protein
MWVSMKPPPAAAAAVPPTIEAAATKKANPLRGISAIPFDQ